MDKDYEYIDDSDEVEHHENITIPVEEYLYLRDRSLWVEILEQAGIEGWEGYKYSQEIFEEYERSNSHVIH
jgi:hypothetical protein